MAPTATPGLTPWGKSTLLWSGGGAQLTKIWGNMMRVLPGEKGHVGNWSCRFWNSANYIFWFWSWRNDYCIPHFCSLVDFLQLRGVAAGWIKATSLIKTKPVGGLTHIFNVHRYLKKIPILTQIVQVGETTNQRQYSQILASFGSLAIWRICETRR